MTSSGTSRTGQCQRTNGVIAKSGLLSRALLKGFPGILRGTDLLPCKSDWHPLKIEVTLTSLVAETTGRETEERGIGEGIGTGIETEVEAGTDLETGVVIEGLEIEGLDIVVGIREDDSLNVYSVLYTLIHIVLLNLF